MMDFLVNFIYRRSSKITGFCPSQGILDWMYLVPGNIGSENPSVSPESWWF